MVLRARQCVPQGTGLPLDNPGPELIITQPGNVPHSMVLHSLSSSATPQAAGHLQWPDSILAFFCFFPPPCLVRCPTKLNFLRLRTPWCCLLPLAFAPAEPLPRIPFLHFRYAFIVCVTSLFQESDLVSPIPKSPSRKSLPPTLYGTCVAYARIHPPYPVDASDGSYCVTATCLTHQILKCRAGTPGF